jgi:predicted transcriptional regulator
MSTPSEHRQSLYGFEMLTPDGRRTERTGTHDIKSLWQRQHEIVNLALTGMKQNKIAEQLEVSPVTVSNALNSTLGREKLSRMRKGRDEEAVKVSEEVERLATKALEVYEEIFDSETASLSLKKGTADTVLMQLGGHAAPTKIDTRSLQMTATPKEIEDFKRRGIQAAKDANMPITIANKGGNGKGNGNGDGKDR